MAVNMTSEERRPIYDERASQMLVMALLAQTEPEIVSAVLGLRRHMSTANVSGHDAKIFFAVGQSSWMQSVMQMQDYWQRGMTKAVRERDLYKARLALVEKAFRRIRSILKAVGGSDTKDLLLQWDIQNKVKLDESDQSDDPSDMALASLYERETPG